MSKDIAPQKALQILTFLLFKVLKSTSKFNTWVPKWCPNFLRRYKMIQADVRKHHNYRGGKRSLLLPSCLPYKHNHLYLPMAGKRPFILTVDKYE